MCSAPPSPTAGARLLRDEGQFQPGGAEDAGAASAPAWTSSRRASLRRARAAGVPGERIIFSGVGKTRAEMALGARREKSSASTSNPSRSSSAFARSRPRLGDARASPSASIPTSTRRPTPRSRPARRRTSSACRSRAPARFTPAPRALPGLKVAGVDMHIGSQITDMQPFDHAFALLADFVRALRADGHAIDHVDLGGGLGIPYRFDNDPPPVPERLRRDRRAQRRAELDCKLYLRARPVDRRQRRRAGRPRSSMSSAARRRTSSSSTPR